MRRLLNRSEQQSTESAFIVLLPHDWLITQLHECAVLQVYLKKSVK